MRFGVCTGLDKAPLLMAAGYDYIELSVAGDLIPDEADSVWNEKRHAIERMAQTTRLMPEAFNSFIRSGKITGPDADPARLERYVHTALARAAQVGGKTIVLGSGGARNVPDGFDRAEAQAQIVQFLHYCADAYEKTGVIVVVEPLNTSESNIITSVAEGATYVRKVNRPGVRNLADTYHMEKDGEPLDAIVKDGDVLGHVHTADSGRVAPGYGNYDHSALFAVLRTAGYDGRISIECRWDDFATQVAPALSHLRAKSSIANP